MGLAASPLAQKLLNQLQCDQPAAWKFGHAIGWDYAVCWPRGFGGAVHIRVQHIKQAFSGFNLVTTLHEIIPSPVDVLYDGASAGVSDVRRSRFFLGSKHQLGSPQIDDSGNLFNGIVSAYFRLQYLTSRMEIMMAVLT